MQTGDDMAAVRLYTLAAEQGDAFAQCNLGEMHQNGEGIRRDDEQASKWCKLAADQGNADAQVKLGLMFKTG